MRTALILLVSLALFSLALLLLGLIWPSDPDCLDGPCDAHDALLIYGFLGAVAFGGLGALTGVAVAVRSLLERLVLAPRKCDSPSRRRRIIRRSRPGRSGARRSFAAGASSSPSASGQ